MKLIRRVKAWWRYQIFRRHLDIMTWWRTRTYRRYVRTVDGVTSVKPGLESRPMPMPTHVESRYGREIRGYLLAKTPGKP